MTHDLPATPYVQPGDLLPDFLRSFWQRQVDTAEQEMPDFRHPPLPLARIKKVMKSDPETKMIAADAPILFCKACEIFISEITARAFIVADSNKRRTLSRADITKALAKSDQFDFLIDIVPRDENYAGGGSSGSTAAKKPPTAANPPPGFSSQVQTLPAQSAGSATGVNGQSTTAASGKYEEDASEYHNEHIEQNIEEDKSYARDNSVI